ncbi:FAD-dependent oxidoreductase [Gemmatimonadota bacterium]
MSTIPDSTDLHIREHPILEVEEVEPVAFFWGGMQLQARRGETISSALFANGIYIFGHHPRDHSPQGIFCANGQCSQCMVIADGHPVKSCMELVHPGVKVEPVEGNPVLPEVDEAPSFLDVEEIEVECLIIGGGPAGLSAAIELGEAGVETLLVDDKHKLGGKLVLQTHKFFGSMADCYAGMRGIEIGDLLEGEIDRYENVTSWVNTNAVAVFSDRKVGLVRDGRHYVLVRPRTMLVAAGAREKSLIFRGNTLPGVYGAGAFQTLVNRDLVRAAGKLFIVGGGNVGLIAGYHALQAGIQVVGLIEALPECGGYKVHKDKLVRFGVPIHTSHTIVSANGTESVESVTIAAIDADWRVIPGTEQSFECDTVLIAVGLDPVDEFYHKSVEYGLEVFSAGDAQEIAEASAAMFSGKIKGREIARALGRNVAEAPDEWLETEKVLKSKPGETSPESVPGKEDGIFPIFHCTEEIPCNPCISVCPIHAVTVGDDIRNTPRFIGEEIGEQCTGCAQCVTICPGLAVTMVDYRKNPDFPIVTIAHEFAKESVKKGDTVTVLDTVGAVLGTCEVEKVRAGAISAPGLPGVREAQDGDGNNDTKKLTKKKSTTFRVMVKAPRAIAKQIAGLQVQDHDVTEPMDLYVERLTDDTIVCRCERVSAGEIREMIRAGSRDINEIKVATRSGMGACGSKTCNGLIKRLFAEEGIDIEEITDNVDRPFFVEIPLGVFCGTEG